MSLQPSLSATERKLETTQFKVTLLSNRDNNIFSVDGRKIGIIITIIFNDDLSGSKFVLATKAQYMAGYITFSSR